MNYSLATTECPHCGMLVRFSYSEVCPSCNIKATDPITESDIGRISRIKYNDFLKKNFKNESSSSPVDSKRALYIFYGALFLAIKLLMLASI